MSALDQPTDHQHPHAPPHNDEAEQSVLGAIMLADTTLYGLIINEGLKADHFYRHSHQAIYQAMLDLYGENREIDVLTVTEHLRSIGRLAEIGGPTAVDALAGAAPVAGNVREYARIVHSNALLRRLLKTTQEIQANVYGHAAPAREVVEWAERDILDVAHDDRQKDFRSIGAVLDEITGGFQPGNLIILAARPSMGKSAFVTNIAENAAIQHRKPVALFSLEMSEAELAQRFVASQARIRGED